MNYVSNRSLAAIACCCALTCPQVSAGDIASAKPESVGMSSERLQRIDDVMQRHIDAFVAFITANNPK